MADTVLKFRGEGESKSPAAARRGLRLSRGGLRAILLIVIPLAAITAGLAFYLSGGRYISTDNAYVGAQKVLITPDISGKVDRVMVREGQRVKAGDPLFEIDPTPFRLAVNEAQGKLDATRTDFNNLKSNLASLNKLVELAQQNVELKNKDVERKQALVGKGTGAPADLDNSMTATVSAQLQAQLAIQQRGQMLNGLLGNPDLPIEQYPAYRTAQATLEQAQRDLDHTLLRAPIDGTATQVDNIQLGRFVMAGTPVLSVLDDAAPWVDANPKETDITNLRVGQKASLSVDSFPDQTFRGTVSSISPGTGAQFQILPPQNASGNWVKVVQRVPVRIAFDPDQDLSLLRSGMSVVVEIDTGHRRTLGTLLGLSRAPAPDAKP
jgi:membrane fusion protein (multidrug efflux system)